LRPYGRAKLQEECLVREIASRVGVRIYRPSSVYGFRPQARRGLFATLIGNALANRESMIIGTNATLRDYVLAEDVGAFMARTVMEDGGEEMRFLLCSGKPTSLFEVLAVIEQLVQRPLYMRFQPVASNARDLSFAPNATPLGWKVTSLEVALATMYARMHSALICTPTRGLQSVGHQIGNT
jgi:UDP-glucose 4-epimerase